MNTEQERAAFEALELIAATDPIEAALDPQRAIRVARAAIAATPAPAPEAALLAELDRLRGDLKSVWHKAEEAAERRGLKLVMQMPEGRVELLAATPAPAELEKAHEARRQAQSELAYFKARLASARLTLMRELKEQGWAPAPAPLTDEQIDEMVAVASIAERNMFRRFARAIERAHGIGQGKEASNG